MTEGGYSYNTKPDLLEWYPINLSTYGHLSSQNICIKELQILYSKTFADADSHQKVNIP